MFVGSLGYSRMPWIIRGFDRFAYRISGFAATTEDIVNEPTNMRKATRDGSIASSYQLSILVLIF